jgi:hypothetical protein
MLEFQHNTLLSQISTNRDIQTGALGPVHMDCTNISYIVLKILTLGIMLNMTRKLKKLFILSNKSVGLTNGMFDKGRPITIMQSLQSIKHKVLKGCLIISIADPCHIVRFTFVEQRNDNYYLITSSQMYDNIGEEPLVYWLHEGSAMRTVWWNHIVVYQHCFVVRCSVRCPCYPG